MPSRKVLALCKEGGTGLLDSYARAFGEIGCEVVYWDLESAVAGHTKFGRVGTKLNSFIPVEPWIAKANRDLFLAARDHRPDLTLVVASSVVQGGTLGQLRAALPEMRTVLIWPDTLLNLRRHTLPCIPLFDLVATYSRATVDTFQRLGAKRILWLPFAADLTLFPADVPLTRDDEQKYGCDVTFIGNHRPEREASIVALVRAGIDVKVWGGPNWQRDATEPSLVSKYWQRSSVFATEFVKAVKCAKVALNLIDVTNYPGANMRFFEHMACRGTSINSSCPEMEPQFPDRVSTVYFETDDEMLGIVHELLGDAELRESVARRGYEQVVDRHCYAHRAKELLAALGLS